MTAWVASNYLKLNPDVQPRTEEGAKQHWLTKGKVGGRLYHPDQLVVTAEFGFELLIYTCYFYWLQKKGLLFNNVITTYPGMRVFYWFVPLAQYKEVARPRGCHPTPSLFLRNATEHVRDFNYQYWLTLPLRQQYYQPARNLSLPTTTKPLLIIHNKYNEEWGGPAVNFIPIPVLTELVKVLTPSYQLIYIRPGGQEKGFSFDHNTLLADFRDDEVLPPDVWRFDKLHAATKLPYNEFKVLLYCRAQCYIGVQGGSSHFTAFFGGRQLILHRRGQEMNSGAYHGWYRQLCPRLPLELTVVKDPALLVPSAREIFGRPPVNRAYSKIK